jgi:hypothetical protein
MTREVWLFLQSTKRLPAIRSRRSVAPGEECVEMLHLLRVKWHLKRLQSQNLIVQAKAILALKELRDPQAIDPLIQILQESRSPSICKEATNALAEYKHSRAIAPLIEILCSRSGECCECFGSDWTSIGQATDWSAPGFK